MLKIDLITGFLGSGKTTFIQKYAQYLMAQGLNIGILENDFGAVNVDMMLLQDLMGDNCELEMISGGCDKETHRRRFRTKLIAMRMCGYDRILVEPSGIYDVDEFFDVLREEPLDEWYEIGNVIAIVDAKLEENMSEAANYILASEVANAGSIVLSHADETTPEEIARTIEHLNQAMKKIQCHRTLRTEIMCRNLNTLSKQDFDTLYSCGYVIENYEKMDTQNYESFDSVYFMDIPFNKEQILSIIPEIMQDSACGDIFRVKGFLKNDEGNWLQLNATHNEVTLKLIETGQNVLIVIGENLNESKIKEYL